MFDAYARSLIEAVPKFPGLNSDECCRALSRSYLAAFSLRHAQRELTLRPELDAVRADLDLLERLGGALESYAVFDRLHGLEIPEAPARAAAFVAAESLSLMGELLPLVRPEDVERGVGLGTASVYWRLEAAMLYSIAGYDANAHVVAGAVIQMIGSAAPSEPPETRLIRTMAQLCQGNVLTVGRQGRLIGHPALDTRDAFCTAIALRVNAYRRWLAGLQETYPAERLAQMLDAIATAAAHVCSVSGDLALADVHHLARVLSASIRATSERSLVHATRLTEDTAGQRKEFHDFLKDTARRGRPFIWPSAEALAKSLLPRTDVNLIISTPTGSGKSTIAELCIAEALDRGWVLYLTPTNALAAQVRRDLERSLRAFSQVTIRAFLGEGEYSALEDDLLPSSERAVAVMTPEKCALYLRLYPSLFETCALCVFDEFHLLGDGNRGFVADLVLARLAQAQGTRLVLVSAMVSNTDDVARWLTRAASRDVEVIDLPWRPSRTLRGLLCLEAGAYQKQVPAATAIVRSGTQNSKTCKVPVLLLVGLAGPWATAAAADYLVVHTGLQAEVKVQRQRRGRVSVKFPGFQLDAARKVATGLASAGLPVINFILSSKHHVFSSAAKVGNELAPVPLQLGEEVDAWLRIAEHELGCRSIQRDLLERRVAAHSSAMVRAEQVAAEVSFREGPAALLFATPTLAQGLNLPTVVSVVSGTRLPTWGTRDDQNDAEADAEGTILNSFGRACRPKIANQGLAILAPDHPTTLGLQDAVPTSSIESFPVLSKPDAAVVLHSPVESVVAAVVEGGEAYVPATEHEAELLALLSDKQGASLVRNTFGAFHRRDETSDSIWDEIHETLRTAAEARLLEASAPDFLLSVALEAGVSVARALSFWQALELTAGWNDASAEDGEHWLDVLIDVLSRMPAEFVREYFASDDVGSQSFRTTLRDLSAAGVCEGPTWSDAWSELKAVAKGYLRGETICQLAKIYSRLPARPGPERHQSAQLPKAFGLIGSVFYHLSLDAGCLLAFFESAVDLQPPQGLASLPFAIRNGLGSQGALSFYRFGTIHERRVAHLLARAFPEVGTADNDGQAAEWVRRAEKQLLGADTKSGTWRAIKQIIASRRPEESDTH